MGDHYMELLRSVVRDITVPVDRLQMLNGEEEQEVLGWSAGAAAAAGSRTVVELIGEQALRCPSALALVYGAGSLSYGELEERSEQLGHYLRGLGVAAEELVAVCVEPGWELVVGILGIWKAGGAYVPVDPDYPADRIGYLLSDSGAKVVVSSVGVRGRLPEGYGGAVVLLDEEWAAIAGSGGKGDLGGRGCMSWPMCCIRRGRRVARRGCRWSRGAC